jgi:endonuclease/exonuclease/phosphatase family metal-dependent hydrolase
LGTVWRALAVGALGLVLTAVMGLEVHGGDEGSYALRVMTFNAKVHLTRGDSVARIAWEVASHDPDVLVMQDASFDPNKELPDPIRAALRERQIYLSGQYIVASRYRLRDCRDGDISYPGVAHSYVRCTLLVNDVEVDLVTAHLASPRRGLDAARHEGHEGFGDWQNNLRNRLLQVGKLMRDLAGAQTPLIVAGDLNAPEHSPVVQSLLSVGLRDAFGSAGVGYGYTVGHELRPGLSFLRIDHILVSSNIGVQRCFVGGSEASEHRPVIADLVLRRK